MVAVMAGSAVDATDQARQRSPLLSPTRYTSPERYSRSSPGPELAAWRRCCDFHPAVAAVRLQIPTSYGKSEILTLRWEYVALELGEMRLPSSTTGTKVVHLEHPAIGCCTA